MFICLAHNIQKWQFPCGIWSFWIRAQHYCHTSQFSLYNTSPLSDSFNPETYNRLNRFWNTHIKCKLKTKQVLFSPIHNVTAACICALMCVFMYLFEFLMHVPVLLPTICSSSCHITASIIYCWSFGLRILFIFLPESMNGLKAWMGSTNEMKHLFPLTFMLIESHTWLYFGVDSYETPVTHHKSKNENLLHTWTCKTVRVLQGLVSSTAAVDGFSGMNPTPLEKK